MEQKLFQDEPSAKLADELYELGKQARETFGEVALGEFLIHQAHLYRTGLWQKETMKMFEALEQEREKDLYENVDFDHLPIN